MVPKYNKYKYTIYKIGYYKNVDFTAFFRKIHVIANSCNSVTFFASFFKCVDVKVKVLLF